MIDTFSKLFLRDLEKLKIEITSYKVKEKLWEISGDIKNSAGNLCLHICGNLQHFIGATLGNSGYVRKRDEEFSRKNVQVKELVEEIETTKKIIESTMNKLDNAVLQKIYPVNKHGEEMTTGYYLMHFFGHLSYHLGQINYQRRLLDF